MQTFNHLPVQQLMKYDTSRNCTTTYLDFAVVIQMLTFANAHRSSASGSRLQNKDVHSEVATFDRTVRGRGIVRYILFHNDRSVLGNV